MVRRGGRHRPLANARGENYRLRLLFRAWPAGIDAERRDEAPLRFVARFARAPLRLAAVARFGEAAARPPDDAAFCAPPPVNRPAIRPIRPAAAPAVEPSHSAVRAAKPWPASSEAAGSAAASGFTIPSAIPVSFASAASPPRA